MKKSTVAIGVIAALALVWTGGAWYTGKTAEAEYQRQIELVNQKWAKSAEAYNTELKIENAKFMRGLFSSDVAYDITFKPLPDSETFVIPLEGKVYHGPLPLNEISRFNLSPAMFSTTGQIVKNEKTQAWFEATKGKNPATSTMTMSYSERMKGDLNIVAGETKYQGIDVVWSDAKIKFDTDKNGEGRFEYDIAHLKSLFNQEAIAAYGEDTIDTMAIELAGLKGGYDLQPTEFSNIFVGWHKGALANMKFGYTYKAGSDIPPIALEFKNWAFDYTSQLKDGFLNYGLNNKAENFNINEHPLGEFRFDMQMNHLSAPILERLVGESSSNDIKAMEQAGLELIQNQPHFHIGPISLTSADGKMDTELNIELDKVDMAQAMQGKLLQFFKQLSFKVNADKTALTNIVDIFMQVGGIPKEEAAKQAQHQVNEMIQYGVHEEMIVETDKGIKSELILENGELKFNGNVIPEEHIGMFILGLMMSQ